MTTNTSLLHILTQSCASLCLGITELEVPHTRPPATEGVIALPAVHEGHGRHPARGAGESRGPRMGRQKDNLQKSTHRWGLRIKICLLSCILRSLHACRTSPSCASWCRACRSRSRTWMPRLQPSWGSISGRTAGRGGMRLAHPACRSTICHSAGKTRRVAQSCSGILVRVVPTRT